LLIKILITGAAGKIGQKFIQSINDKFFEISCLTRSKIKWKDKSIISYIGNLEDIDSLKQIPKQDIIVHIAGITHSKYFKKYVIGNVKATENLVSYFKNFNIKHFIFISTRSANKFSGSYGLSKLMAEKIIIKSKLPYSILRVAEVYGKDMKGFNLLKKIINFPIFTFYPYSNKIKLSPIHINDVCSLLNQILMSKAKNKTFIVAGPNEYGFKELCEIITEYYGMKNIYVPVPILLIRVIAYFNLILKKPLIYPDQVARLVSKKSNDIKLLKTDFNFKPKSVEDLVEKI
tara:strand:- start:4194 stop:5060 length:867 start_codon:yes stop_codon:yes gene_type:complete